MINFGKIKKKIAPRINEKASCFNFMRYTGNYILIATEIKLGRYSSVFGLQNSSRSSSEKIANNVLILAADLPVSILEDEKAVTDQWEATAGNDGVELKDEKGIDFLQKLYNAENLFVRMAPLGGEHSDMDINLNQSTENDIKSAINVFAETCGWSPE